MEHEEPEQDGRRQSNAEYPDPCAPDPGRAHPEWGREHRQGSRDVQADDAGKDGIAQGSHGGTEIVHQGSMRLPTALREVGGAAVSTA